MTVTYMFKHSEDTARLHASPDADIARDDLDEVVAQDAPDAQHDLDSLASPASEETGAAEKPPQPSADRGPQNLPVKWTPLESQLILVSKSRGGGGATSLAVNLALELRKKPRLFGSDQAPRVVVVDFDVQFGKVASLLDLECHDGMIELVRMFAEPDAHAVGGALSTHSSGLRVLAAPSRAIPLDALDPERAGAIVSALMKDFDYVVVDLPSALVPWLEPLLVRASRLLMVTDLAVPSVTSAKQVIDLMREDNPDLVVDIVVSREKRPIFPKSNHREASAALGLPFVDWLPDEPKLFRKATDRGEPLTTFAPRCAWSKAIKQSAKRLHTSNSRKAVQA